MPTAKPNPPRDVRTRIAHVLELVVFSALLTLIALTAIPYGTNGPMAKALFECVVLALAAMWIIEGMLSGSWLRPAHRLLVPGLVLLAYALLQTLPFSRANIGGGIEGAVWRAVSFDPQSTRLAAMKLLAYILVLALLLRYTNNRRRLRALIYLVIGIAVASAVFGMVRQMTQREAGFLLPGLMPGMGYGQFINPNHFAFLMEMVLGLTLGLIVAGGVRREKILIYLATALPLWAALVLSNSRGGILSMLSQMLFLVLIFSLSRPGRAADEKPNWLLRASRSSAVRAVVIIALLLGTVFSVFWLGGERLAGRLVQNDEFTAEPIGRDVTPRQQIWSSTWQVIKANPVFGVGFGAYWVSIDEFSDRSGQLKPYAAHNDYLDILASGGLVGLALAGWFVFLVIKRARIQLRAADPFRRAACAGALVGLLGVAVHSLVDFGLQRTVNAAIFVVLIAIATAEIGGLTMTAGASGNFQANENTKEAELA
jgi:O-antigen ligase